MKKKVIVMAVALVSICTAATVSVNDAQASESFTNLNLRDTHCTKCGLHNGSYRCPAFRAIKGHPTDCLCGHEKKSHVGC